VHLRREIDAAGRREQQLMNEHTAAQQLSGRGRIAAQVEINRSLVRQPFTMSAVRARTL